MTGQQWFESLSLEEKIGQVMIIGFDGTTLTPELKAMITEYHVGGVILFARNVESPEQVARLCNDLQQAATESGHPGLLIAIDQEGGRVARLTEAKGFTEFPGAMAIGATGSPDNARQVAAAMAAEMRAVGINVDFAPDLDVNNNPQNPVIGVRSYGSEPQQVAAFGTAAIEGLQAGGVLAFGKHFPGHGDTGTDSHVALPQVAHPLERLETVEFVPFEAAIRANVAGIMSAHVTFPAIDATPGTPANVSSKVLTDLLRQEMQFTGLVVTDS
nr:beta-N-acetylhexosaminidase [Longilinea sp.]